ncbi:MAG: nucleotidyltransferase domain-containing protein [Candidatus Stygibacter australis]|nr:nucleotidyltransferase domain-containing protein [Candidatus Stygibacter australis]
MIQELALFGSVLRSDFNAHSDIDILVSFQKGAALSYFDLCDLQEDEKLFNRKIDLVEKGSLKNPYRRTEILKSARRIYAA